MTKQNQHRATLLLISFLGVTISNVASAQSNLFVNGDFEVGPGVNGNGIAPLDAGSTAILGWVVTRGQVDYSSAVAWQAASGTHSLDLAGSPGVGGVSQTVQTTVDCVYLVQFSFAANPSTLSSPAVIKRLKIRAGDQVSPEFTFDRTGHSNSSMGWSSQQWLFTAIAPTTEMEFYNTTPGDVFGGPALDNVAVMLFLSITDQPGSTIDCPSDTTVFSVTAVGSGPLTYLWQWRPLGTTAWLDILDGLNTDPNTGEPAFDASGATQVSVTMTNAVGTSTALSGGRREIQVIVSNACGSVTSDTATWTICPADFNCDNFLNGDDFDQYVTAFETGDAAADFNQDGFVSGDDFDLFVAAFEAGC